MTSLIELLAETKRICEGASREPWAARINHGMGETWTELRDADNQYVSKMRGDLNCEMTLANFPNEAFIAHARTMLPRLVAALELAISYIDDQHPECELESVNEKLARVLNGEVGS